MIVISGARRIPSDGVERELESSYANRMLQNEGQAPSHIRHG